MTLFIRDYNFKIRDVSEPALPLSYAEKEQRAAELFVQNKCAANLQFLFCPVHNKCSICQ